jgi:phosphonate degradation associated HDIG domain protein
MTPAERLNRIERLFAERGGAEYHGEAVTQLEHALQCAALAEAERRPPAWIVAALLHDIGHMLHGHGEDCATHGHDDRHEELGMRYLTAAFGPDVTEPIRLHVAAKRYLCAKESHYFDGLSPASVASLALQGGPMTAAEMTQFEAHPHAEAAIALRRWDDRAKVVGLPTPRFDHYRLLLHSCLRPEMESPPSK